MDYSKYKSKKNKKHGRHLNYIFKIYGVSAFFTVMHYSRIGGVVFVFRRQSDT